MDTAPTKERKWRAMSAIESDGVPRCFGTKVGLSKVSFPPSTSAGKIAPELGCATDPRESVDSASCAIVANSRLRAFADA